MKYAAVVFDMFGTLVDNFSQELYRRVLTDMATVLAAPPDAFHDLWHGLFAERMTGTIRSPDGLIDHICRVLEVRPDESQRRQAIEIRLVMTRREIILRPDAVAVLERLKAEGYGAAEVGMTAVMIRTPDDPRHRLHMEAADWPGPLVSSLTEVLALLE